jgi:hypothetical protein
MNGNKIPIFDPTVEMNTNEENPAKRKSDLNKKKCGLLWNSKIGGDKLMHFILEELNKKGITPSEIVELKKEYDTRPAKKEMYEEMAKKCDFVITAVGD